MVGKMYLVNRHIKAKFKVRMDGMHSKEMLLLSRQQVTVMIAGTAGRNSESPGASLECHSLFPLSSKTAAGPKTNRPEKKNEPVYLLRIPQKQSQ